jgi:hypothetical protein
MVLAGLYDEHGLLYFFKRRFDMIDNYPTPIQTSPRGALQIQIQAREQEKQIALLAATYKQPAQVSSARSENPFKNLLANLFSGMKVNDREFAGAARK